MIKVEKTNSYKTFYWPSKSDVYDTERMEDMKVKLFGITIFKKHRTFNAEYFEQNKSLGFKSIQENK